MRNLNIFLSCCVFFLASCGESYVPENTSKTRQVDAKVVEKYDAVTLNNQVSSIQKGAVQVVETVFKSDPLTVDQKLKDAIFDLDVSLSRLNSLGQEHEMAKYFSESVMQLASYYKDEFESNFNNVISILKKKDLSDQDRQILNDYDQSFADEEALLFQEVLVRQDSFARYFGIGLSN